MKKKRKTSNSEKKENIFVFMISIIALIIGGIAFNFWLSLLIIGTLNIILFVPTILKNKRKKKKTTNKRKKKRKKSIPKYILIAFFTLTIIIILGMIIFAFIIIKNAPTFEPEKLYKKEATILYDSNGQVITKIGKEIREKITHEEMSEVLINAIIATEDSRFFQHNGFDLPRFLKASFGQALGKNAGGASTLTMQIVKKHFTSTKDKGIEGILRKFTDIYLSIFKIEKKYTKFEILEFYANSNYLGGLNYGGVHGVEQASQLYFNKNAKDLSLPEAALIAGLFQAPSAYDPYLYPEKAEARRKVVLSLMKRHGYINSLEYETAKKITTTDLLVEQNHMDNGNYVGIINTVTDEILKTHNLDPFETPMDIYTTFEIEKQDHINKILSGESFTWENDMVDAGISVINVNTGEIIAISAGRHKNNLKGFNLAIDSKRHIGSSAKPLYDYGPGIEYNNWSTYFPFTDEPHGYTTGTKIYNWDLKYEGLVTLRHALRVSRNIPALKAFQSVNNKNITKFVTSLGLHPEIENNLIHESHALGGYTGESPTSVAAAYASFANGGYYIKPHSVKKIVFKDTNEVFEYKIKKEKVMSPSTAYMISSVLLDAARWGLSGNWNVNGVNYCAKTGTSNYPSDIIQKYGWPSNAINDLWIAAYTPDYAIAQWYGYEINHRDYYNKFGSPEFRKLFQTVAKGIFKENKSFTKPDDVLSVAIEKETVPAMLPSEFTPDNMIITELFKKGTEPTEISKRYDQLENPSNLELTDNDNNLEISWNPIKTPNAINKDELTRFSKKMFFNENSQITYLNQRLAYNEQNIGDIGYNVYLKKDDKLELLGFTKNNYFTTPLINEKTTIVVKSSYSIFKDNLSSGIEATIIHDNKPKILITSELNGKNEIKLLIGDIYEEIEPSINVFDDMENVTNMATIDMNIIEKETEITVDKIDTSIPNTYLIIYKVKYKDYNKTHTRKIIIE